MFQAEDAPESRAGRSFGRVRRRLMTVKRRIARNEFRQAYFPPAKAFAINALEDNRANHAADRIDGAGAHVARGMQHVEGALEPRISDLRDLQLTVSHAVPHIGDRQYRVGDIAFYKLLDDLERVGL